MIVRPSFLGSLHQNDAPERGAEPGFDTAALRDGPPIVRLDDRDAPQALANLGGGGGVFDPIWGTLDPAVAPTEQGWLAQEDDSSGGAAIGVEILGNGFQISGQLRTGGFDRLSDWINMQSGFIQIRDALQVPLGMPDVPEHTEARCTLWVRLEHVTIIAERTPAQPNRPGAPIVQKQRRKVSIATPDYNLQGSIHVHAHGSMAQFLETPDPHFIPVTDMTVRWLANSTLTARFPFALLNREKLVTILDATSATAKADTGSDESADERRREQQGDTSSRTPRSLGPIAARNRAGRAV